MPNAWPMMPWGIIRTRKAVFSAGRVPTNHRSGQKQDDEFVDLAEGETEYARPHEPQHLAHAGVAQGQEGAIAGALAAQPGQLHQ